MGSIIIMVMAVIKCHHFIFINQRRIFCAPFLWSILYSPKNHNLDELIRGCKAYTTELCKAFPRNTPEEERLFDLLQRSYIESRYNPNFEITKDDICALVPKVELLKQIVEKVCRERFDYYDSRISEMSE